MENSEQYPEAHFETLSVESQGAGRFQFSGNPTFFGLTAPIALQGVINGGANNMLTGKYTLGFTATGSFRLSSFGMGKYIPAVGDEVFLEIYAEFVR